VCVCVCVCLKMTCGLGHLCPAGLAEAAGACYIISGTGNRGDGFIMCDKERAYNTSGYEVG